MATIISRVGFCDSCCKNQNPRTGIYYVVMGATNGWHIYKAQNMTRFIGYVPMNYKLIKVIGENVIYEKLCSIHGCGMDVYWEPSQQCYKFDQGKWERGMMTLNQWNCLQQIKHDEQYEI